MHAAEMQAGAKSACSLLAARFRRNCTKGSD